MASDREPDVRGEKGTAVSGGKAREGCSHSSRPMRNDTILFPTLVTVMFGKASVTRRVMAITLILEPGNLVVIIECSIDNRTDSTTFSWN